MAVFTRPEFCLRCRQDLLRDCPLDHNRANPCLLATLHKFVLLADQFGFSCADLLVMLSSGMSVAEILDLIVSRVTAA